jgi:hypothetical protein
MAAAKKAGKSRNGNKKHHRNKIWCESYYHRGQREKNKKVKLNRHLARHPNDEVAKKAL